MCKAAKRKTNEELLSVAQEIAFAKALAANDKALRDRALKKLKKWFILKSTQEINGLRFTEEGFMRIWKGLFYCVWMSDKPLIQEEVVEAISTLIHCFSQLEDAQKFIRCFFQSISQAWFGLDGFRIDKYLMLVRRFLRQIFEYLYKNEWDDENVEAVSNDFNKSFIMAPLGLNLHLTEVYLEELAKVGRGELNPKTVSTLIKPFADNMSLATDTRYIKYVTDYIFLHLIRQSEEGIKYQEKFNVWKHMGFPEGDINVIQEASDDEMVMDDDGNEENDDMDDENEGALDPRAGKVDVLLPPIAFDPQSIKQYLEGIIRRKDVTTKARKAIQRLTMKYATFIEGKYPLGIHTFELPEREDREELIQQSAEELLAAEKAAYAEGKPSKKSNKRSSDEWQVSPLQEQNTGQDDNTTIAGTWEIQNLTKKRRVVQRKEFAATMKEIEVTLDESLLIPTDNDNNVEENEKAEEIVVKTDINGIDESKKTGKRKRKSKTKAQNNSESENVPLHSSVAQKLQESRISPQNKTPNQNTNSNKKSKTSEPNGDDWGLMKEWDTPSSNETEIVIPISPYLKRVTPKGKLNKSKISLKSTPTLQKLISGTKTPGSSKKVEFVLNKNTAQEDYEYKLSLKNSPIIPFDADKKPRQGVLKSTPVNSPINPFYTL